MINYRRTMNRAVCTAVAMGLLLLGATTAHTVPRETAVNMCNAFADNHPPAEREEFIRDCLSRMTIDGPARPTVPIGTPSYPRQLTETENLLALAVWQLRHPGPVGGSLFLLFALVIYFWPTFFAVSNKKIDRWALFVLKLLLGLTLIFWALAMVTEPPDVARSKSPVSFHYNDDVGNCSLYLQARDFEHMKQISDELDLVCKPDVSTCSTWIAKRADVGLPATHPQRSAILERSLHRHLTKAAASADSWWLDVPEKNELAAWVDKYCAANPEHLTSEGAFRFVGEQIEREKGEAAK